MTFHFRKFRPNSNYMPNEQPAKICKEKKNHFVTVSWKVLNRLCIGANIVAANVLNI